ncbi:glutathione peroxidase [Galbibacter orientalis DSM 19592]|uniref:Glutathione peroxidase n=1 Tax=Galbibacter orientalis DSM 19592 TaxID=926559 RepID=I3C1S0_9FLAO|nr:glutathione peroxidase [Galbibacter orientalis]EIJ37563.1 glutathione peroxidase [Galbibacter orientalis DSM 19592]
MGPTTSFYDFEAVRLNGERLSLDRYKGKAVIVVNTASKCGLTPQYEGLESLYQKYKDEGLVILGFPCNQFGNQEKGNSEEIKQFCQVNYGVSFPMFEKIEVNGKNAHPLFKFLKKSLPESSLLGSSSSKIEWNFTKFLIDKNGNPTNRYAPRILQEKMEKDIKKTIV